MNVSSLLSRLIAFASLIIIAAGLKQSAELIGPVLFAFTLTLLIWPILKWLEKKGIPRFAALCIVTGSVLLILIIFISVIFQSLNQISQKLPYYSSQFDKQISPFLDFLKTNHVDTALIQKSGIDGSTIFRTIINSISDLIANIFSVSIFLFTLLLMIISAEGFVKKFKTYYKKKGTFLKNFTVWSKNIQDQYRVQTLSNLISGVITTILFLILRIDYAILWGILVFVLAYIPNIGITLASIPPVVLAFILFGWQTALLTIALIVILNIIMDNVVTPRFMGEKLNLPTIIVFFSFIFWTWIFGTLGAFISLPITLAIRGLLSQSPKTAFIAQMLATEDKPSKTPSG